MDAKSFLAGMFAVGFISVVLVASWVALTAPVSSAAGLKQDPELAEKCVKLELKYTRLIEMIALAEGIDRQRTYALRGALREIGFSTITEDPELSQEFIATPADSRVELTPVQKAKVAILRKIDELELLIPDPAELCSEDGKLKVWVKESIGR